MDLPELTDAQIRALDGLRNVWLAHGLATGAADRAEAEAGVADAYRTVGLEPPARFLWFGSPSAGAMCAGILAGTRARPGDRDHVWARVREVRAQMEAQQVPDHVGVPVADRLWDQDRLWGQVQNRLGAGVGGHITHVAARDEVWFWVWEHVRAQVREEMGTRVQKSLAGQQDAEWLAAYDYFRTHGSVLEAEQLSGIMRVARSAGRWWPFENVAVLTERPVALHRDSEGRLHHNGGPAVLYPDGFAVWAWHGVRLPRHPVRTRPAINRAGRDFESEALVVRTDYSDGDTWREVVNLFEQPDGERRVGTHIVDDPAFAGASPDEVVLSALAGDPGLEVVFLADAATMKWDHTLLAVSTRRQDLEDEEDEEGEEVPSKFRLGSSLVNEVHVNLAIGHLSFFGFAYEAARHPDNVLRW
ncbi:hypothetical protein O7599_05715 [Streptomyces sp. WMMC500]|uniref:DUF6745 domain-containing protein n=1 Tax=Streptomyces sp. WMMC500 TaxID=3015154 RepID=UPI00248AC7F2|nr:hypothetical protein [Streptomyces sp. WMMC500]WBB62037.1 hypothetical protein O7599_05715 [Streptomyces sp. WMMC500]